MRESNAIEGEDWGKLPEEAMVFALAHVHKLITPDDILEIHRLHKEADMLYHGGRERMVYGQFRMCHVRVGGHMTPGPILVPSLMRDFCDEWSTFSAWGAHCRFEYIHPFEDLNGRVGRLLWLVKALEEGYDYSIPFLQMFYYQTLKIKNQPVLAERESRFCTCRTDIRREGMVQIGCPKHSPAW